MSPPPRTQRPRSARTEQIQRIIDERGFTHEQVTIILEVNIGTVKRWLLPMDANGHRDPPISAILALKGYDGLEQPAAPDKI